MQKVANPGAWPSYQRFAYLLVRVRPLSFIEQMTLAQEPDSCNAGRRLRSSLQRSSRWSLNCITP
jgi:hypothetical protein